MHEFSWIQHDSDMNLTRMFWTYVSNTPLEVKRWDYPPLCKARRPNFENPVHGRNPHMPRCIDSEKWKPSTTEQFQYYSRMSLPHVSFLGCCHYIIERFTLLDCQTLNLLYANVPFVWTQKNIIIWSYTCSLDHIMKGTFHEGLFTSSTNTLSTLRRHAQTIPLELGSGTCKTFYLILNFATLQKRS